MPSLIVFGGIKHEPSPYKLVVKMSGSQSAGISNGWSKTVIISSEVEDDWGEALRNQPCEARMDGFESTGYDPFIFAFLVRDGDNSATATGGVAQNGEIKKNR